VGASSGTVGYGIEYTPTDQQVFSLTANLATGEVRHFADTNYFPTFYANNAERMRIDGAGNVGIGTTSFVGKLSVSMGDATSSGAPGAWDNTYALFGGTTANAGAVAIGYNSSTGGSISALSAGVAWRTMSYQANIHRFLINGGEKMRVASDGNVGIGNSIPGAYGARLAIGDPGDAFSNTLLTLTQYATFSITANGVTPAAGTTFDWSWANGGQGPLKFSSSGTERMRITSAGLVGIGTSAPNHTLDVAGNVGLSGNIYMGQGFNNGNSIEVGYGRTGSNFAYIDLIGDTTYSDYGFRMLRGNNGANANSQLNHRGTGAFVLIAEEAAPIAFQTSSTERARISAAGGFSVGTTADPGAGAIYATGNITAYYSDDRLKTRLGDIDDALGIIDKIDAFYYEANETAKGLGYEAVREVGVSAQSVQRVLPEVVAPAPIDAEYLTVRYERLVPVLIQAIKELTARVAQLEGK
jgi:hypothetical protein